MLDDARLGEETVTAPNCGPVWASRVVAFYYSVGRSTVDRSSSDRVFKRDPGNQALIAQCFQAESCRKVKADRRTANLRAQSYVDALQCFFYASWKTVRLPALQAT